MQKDNLKKFDSSINPFQEETLPLLKSKEKELAKQLKRVKVTNGYVMTTNPEKWEAYKRGDLNGVSQSFSEEFRTLRAGFNILEPLLEQGA